MGPKKKVPVIVDGVDTTPMTFSKLQNYCMLVFEKLLNEREERNNFQLERDKLRTFWEITKKQLDECRAQLRNHERAVEDEEKRHLHQLKDVDQKVKHLRYENFIALNEQKARELNELASAEQDYTDREAELLQDKKEIKSQLREMERTHHDELKAEQIRHASDLSKTRKTFVEESRQMEVKFDKRIQTLTTQLNLKHHMEMTEIEERKNKQLADLIKNHKNDFSDIKSYYNEITLNNLSLISSLRNEVQDMRHREAAMEKQVREVAAENKRLVEPMLAALAEKAEAMRQLAMYKREVISLQGKQKKLTKSTQELEDLKWEKEVLLLRFEQLRDERKKSEEAVLETLAAVQQDTGKYTVLLEHKVQALLTDNQLKDCALEETLAVAGVSPSQMPASTARQLLAEKNDTIQSLQFELAKVRKHYSDLVRTYRMSQQIDISFGNKSSIVAKGPAGPGTNKDV